MNQRPNKPKFAEAMTHVRHANTVIQRLSSYSGLRHLPPEDPPERTVLAGPNVRLPGVGFGEPEDGSGSGSKTDPGMMDAAQREDSGLAPLSTLIAPLSTPAVTPLPAHLPAPPPTLPEVAATARAGGSQPEIETRVLNSFPGTQPVQLESAAFPSPASEGTEGTEGAEGAEGAEGEHGEVIVMFGCRGGAGATTIAVNLAAELAQGRRGAVVLDLDLQMGDVLCALDLAPVATLAELLVEIDALDMASLRRRLTAHASGLFAVSQGDRFDQLEQLRPERIPALIAGLSRQFGAVVIDGLRDFSDLSISALDMADRIVLVVPEDVTGVKNASRCLDVFRRLGYGDAKLAVLVNSHDPKSKVTPAAIAETLRHQPLAVLPTDSRAARVALDEGLLLRQHAPRSRLTQAIAEVAGKLAGGEVLSPRSSGSSSGLMGLLRGLFGGNR